jgi:hypothetical protein
MMDSESFRKSAEGSHLDMYEWLVDKGITDADPASFGDHLEMTSRGKDNILLALAVYRQRKGLVLSIKKFSFVLKEALTSTSAQDERMKELISLLLASKIEAERLREELIPDPCVKEIDSLLAQQLPYSWMTSLIVGLKERVMTDAASIKGKLEIDIWRVVHEEYRAKRQSKNSVQPPALQKSSRSVPAQGPTAPLPSQLSRHLLGKGHGGRESKGTGGLRVCYPNDGILLCSADHLTEDTNL